MARRYTITNVTEVGSGVQSFRSEIKNRQEINGSPNKGFSNDQTMRNMFPRSPLYALQGNQIDNQIINIFKEETLNRNSQISTDFTGTEPNSTAYIKFNHPQAVGIDMNDMHMPLATTSVDKPYAGYPNLQVKGINPLTPRDSIEDGLLRPRTIEDGGFGTKNFLKNYPSKDVRLTIGEYFVSTRNGNDQIQQPVANEQIGRFKSIGNSTMTYSNPGDEAKPQQVLSKDINNFNPINSNS
jgi:hypothetical protein